MLKSVAGLLTPESGTITTNGKVVALLELGTGFDGDLNLPENIRMRGALLGYSKEFIEEKIDQILEFAELEDFRWYKYKQLSSGMRSRLAFSICCMVEPEILMLDEVLAVGDGGFRQKSNQKMLEIIKSGATTLFVGHNSGIIRQLCTKLLWLDRGKPVAYAETRPEALELLKKYERFLKVKATDPKALPDLSPIAAPKKKPVNPKDPAALEQTIQKLRLRERYHLCHMGWLQKLIQQPELAGKAAEVLKEKGISHVAIYSDNVWMETVAGLLQKAGIVIDYVVSDQKNCSYCKTVYEKSLAEYPETGCILVGDLLLEEAVEEKLKLRTEIPRLTMQALFPSS